MSRVGLARMQPGCESLRPVYEPARAYPGAIAGCAFAREPTAVRPVGFDAELIREIREPMRQEELRVMGARNVSDATIVEVDANRPSSHEEPLDAPRCEREFTAQSGWREYLERREG